MDEMAELQQNYDEIVSEKSRLESLWLATQQSEEELRNELLRLLEEVKILEKELLGREQIIQHQKALLEGGTNNEKEHCVDEGGIPSVREIPSVGVDEGTSSNFEANRSLIAGKINISSLEVLITTAMYVATYV